ncbi:hypothetical protein BBJ28_00020303 [Nothophytophthora sp. Chile5]|nr:hypothetical protein BBJ28_00020303 [Nothophytophthora sp. Chile5]
MTPAPLKHVKQKATKWFHWLHEIKTEHQYLGRYSIKKLDAFHAYQERTSVFRVAAVIVLTPLPTLLTLWSLDCIPLRDPRGGPTHHATTFLRSALSHTIMTYMFLMAGKQAVGLDEKNSKYTHKLAAVISLCVAVCLESFWLIWAFAWRFPIPMREFLGVMPWSVFTVTFNYVFAKQELARVWGRLKRYIPVVGTQLILFYFLLFLSVGFAAVPWWVQIILILIFPVVKLSIKRTLWKYARSLNDISTDVTICMVEISGSLYQTVCMNYVQSNLMALLLMALDFLQAAHEARLYVHHDYIGDSKSTLHTAIKIVESAKFFDDVEKPKEPSSVAKPAPKDGLVTPSGDSSEPSKPGAKPQPSLRDMRFELEPVDVSFRDVLVRVLRKGTSWSRRRRHRANRRHMTYTAEAEGTTVPNAKVPERRRSKPKSHESSDASPRPSNSQGTTHTARNSITTSREAVTSIYVNANVIRRGRSRRLLDFGQVYAIQKDKELSTDEEQTPELPTADATPFVPYSSNDPAAYTSRGSMAQTSRGSLGSLTSRASTAGTETARIDGNEDHPNVVVKRKSVTKQRLLKRISSRTIVPAVDTTGRGQSRTATTTPRTARSTVDASDDDDHMFGHHGIQIHGKNTGVMIDDVLIRRKDQARILEQTLQMLFASEVLLFVEYMEVFMPVLYGSCIGGLWHLSNAKYNVMLMRMSYNAMLLEVGTSFGYAMLEVVSFLSVYLFLKRKYGISALYQLAFLLETYAMTLQGKLIGCFITILNSSTLHQGIDITFKFNLDALLKTPDPYKN